MANDIADPQVPDLEDELTKLGYSAEAFAHFIDRNAAGLRRTMKSDERSFSPDVAEDIAAGLKELGYEGNPWKIKQLGSVRRRVLKQYGVTREQSEANYREEDFYRGAGLSELIASIVDRHMQEIKEEVETGLNALIDREVERRVSERLAAQTVRRE